MENLNENANENLNEKTGQNIPDVENEYTETAEETKSLDNSENMSDSEEGERIYGGYMNEPITYSAEGNSDKKGSKVFFTVLFGALLISLACIICFFIGKNYSGRLSAAPDLSLSSKPVNQDEMTVEQIYEKNNKSVVGVTVFDASGNGSSASGVVYSEDGYIITNDHLMEGITDPQYVITDYEGKTYRAIFIAGDVRSDLAILKINTQGMYPAEFGNSDECVIGESILTIGRANNVKVNSITKGIVSLLNRRIKTTSSYSAKCIQVDAAISPGSSGGALVNMYGQIIGITSSKAAGEQTEGISFAIPSVTVKRIVDSLIKYGYVENRAKMGISYYELDGVYSVINGTDITGVMVASVSEDSDFNGKLNVGDVIAEINGTPITSDSVILDIIEQSKPGDTVDLTVYDENGNSRTVSGTLSADNGNSSYKHS